MNSGIELKPAQMARGRGKVFPSGLTAVGRACILLVMNLHYRILCNAYTH